MTITFGLPYRKESARIDIATEAYPNRWTHHVMIGTEEEIDEELISWIQEAADFSDRKWLLQCSGRIQKNYKLILNCVDKIVRE